MPLISLALLKNRDTFNVKIDRLIKEKFTALQPSVEWKFAECAWEYMHSHAANGGPTLHRMLFLKMYIRCTVQSMYAIHPWKEA